MSDRVETKIIRSLSHDPWHNLAVEEYLLNNVYDNQLILYLWQNQNTVVIGRNQNVWRECRCKELESDGGKLARRLSGGGAVFHDLGNLNFTFIMHKELYNLEKQLEVILQAVRKAGIEAEFSGRNDLTIHGKKFSGNAFYASENSAYHHGTLLINTDFSKLTRYLQVSREKIVSKGIDSIQSRVVNLSSIDNSLTVEKMIKNVQESFVQQYGGSMSEFLIDEMTEDVKLLYSKYASWDWRYGQTPEFDISMRERFTWGEIELGFSLEDGHITKASIYSDAMNYRIFQIISTSLEQCPFQMDALISAISKIHANLEEQNILDDLKEWLKTKEF